ncbi:MAG: hypothetical protein WA140_01330 [Geobacteraceae bacterium]
MEKKGATQPRLCSEIRLFDLCQDEDICSHKDGRYCTKGDILARFEAIAEDDDPSPEQQYIADELEYLEEGDDIAYDDSFDTDDEEEEEEEEEEP